MTPHEILEVIDAITYKDGWILRVEFNDNDWYLQWRFFERDLCNPDDPTLHEQGCRKWRLSPHMTRSEIVLTAFLAAKTAETHEMHEAFRLHGKQVFNPHIDVFALAEAGLPLDARQHEELAS